MPPPRAPTFDGVLHAGFAQLAILCGLELQDLQRLEVADRSAQQVVLGGGVWLRRACNAALPEFLVPLPSRSCAPWSKAAVCGVVASLRWAPRAALAGPVLLPSFALAEKLAAALDHARRRAEHQRCQEGVRTHITVAAFAFPSTLTLQGDAEPSSVSSRVGMTLLRAGGEETWDLRLAVHSAGALVGARRRKARQSRRRDAQERRTPCAEKLGSELRVDVQSVSDRVALRLVDARLQADGAWAGSLGFCAALGGGDVSAGVADGLVAVVCLREPIEAPATGGHSSVHALSLDAPRAGR